MTDIHSGEPEITPGF